MPVNVAGTFKQEGGHLLGKWANLDQKTNVWNHWNTGYLELLLPNLWFCYEYIVNLAYVCMARSQKIEVESESLKGIIKI